MCDVLKVVTLVLTYRAVLVLHQNDAVRITMKFKLYRTATVIFDNFSEREKYYRNDNN
jgi:hypothetical protein